VGVEGLPGEDLAIPEHHQWRRDPDAIVEASGGPVVADAPTVAVDRCCGRLQRRSDRGRRLVGVLVLHQCRDAGYVRARHGRPRDDVVVGSPPVDNVGSRHRCVARPM